MFAHEPFIQRKQAFFSMLPLIPISFCQNKNRSVPKLQFLTVCESPGTLTKERVQTCVWYYRFAPKTTSTEHVLAKNLILYKWCGRKINHWQNNVRGERSAHFSTELFCPCKAAALFLKQGTSSDRGRTIDHLMYVVLWNVSVSLCALSGTSLAKCSLCVHLSPSLPSITALGKDIFHSEQDQKQEMLPNPFKFSVPLLEDRNTLPLSCLLSVT